MRKMLSAMESLCGQSSGTPYDKVYAFYKKYYLGIKNYFPATLVNADAKRYEIAKIAYNHGSYTNDTDPITQSHGDFCSAETAWVKKRIMYIMSKYSYGLFSNSGTDTIIVRAAGDLIDYEITPAFDMYPAIANGTSIVQGARTKAGEVCRMTIDLGGSADQAERHPGGELAALHRRLAPEERQRHHGGPWPAPDGAHPGQQDRKRHHHHHRAYPCRLRQPTESPVVKHCHLAGYS